MQQQQPHPTSATLLLLCFINVVASGEDSGLSSLQNAEWQLPGQCKLSHSLPSQQQLQ